MTGLTKNDLWDATGMQLKGRGAPFRQLGVVQSLFGSAQIIRVPPVYVVGLIWVQVPREPQLKAT